MTDKRFKLIDWSQEDKFIEDTQKELPALYFDNDSDVEKWYNFLNNSNDFIEQNAKLHSKISKLRRELIQQEKEHSEDKFKLNTLEKFYKCSNCSFNEKEFAYLKSLKKL